MGQELEAAGLASLEGSALHVAAPRREVCANCATPLSGPWCHACGQADEDYHRSVLSLLGDVLDNFLHFDGRLWRTLPDLMVRPGRLTRSYLDGHRAPQVPPLRLFLVCLLIVFVAAGFGRDPARSTVAPSLDAGGQAQVVRRIEAVDDGGSPAAAWFKSRLAAAARDPDRFSLILGNWSERFAFLALPLGTLLLCLLFAFDRRFMLFDHLIFSLHSLAFTCLLLTVVLLASRASAAVGWALLALIPVHLFAHLRGVYGLRPLRTLLLMAGLAVGSIVGTAAIVLGLLWTGLSSLPG